MTLSCAVLAIRSTQVGDLSSVMPQRGFREDPPPHSRPHFTDHGHRLINHHVSIILSSSPSAVRPFPISPSHSPPPIYISFADWTAKSRFKPRRQAATGRAETITRHPPPSDPTSSPATNDAASPTHPAMSQHHHHPTDTKVAPPPPPLPALLSMSPRPGHIRTATSKQNHNVANPLEAAGAGGATGAATRPLPLRPRTGPRQPQIFPFFSLPRELRDQIYAHALVFKHKLPSQHHVRLRARRVPILSLLLVSRQFRTEYHETAERLSCLIVVDRNTYHGEPLLVPRGLTYIRRLEVFLATCCEEPTHRDLTAPHPLSGRRGCGVVPEMRMHRTWLTDLVGQLRGLEGVKVEVLLDPQQALCEGFLLAEQHRLMGGVRGLGVEIKGFEVCYAEYLGSGEEAWNFLRKRRVVMRWDAERGQLIRISGEGRGHGGGEGGKKGVE